MSLNGSLAVDVTDHAVNFSLTVENGGPQPVDLKFRSGKRADLVVYGDGDEIWCWSDGRLFTQSVQTETLAPGRSLTAEMKWNDPPPGEYSAVASLEAANEDLVSGARFKVP